MEDKLFGEPSTKKGFNKIELIGFGLYPMMLGILFLISSFTSISWFTVAGSWLIGISFIAFVICLTSNNSLLKLKKEYSYKKTYIISTTLFAAYMILFVFVF